MNYAIYFGLTFLACFMSFIIFAILLVWIGDTLLWKEEE